MFVPILEMGATEDPEMTVWLKVLQHLDGAGSTSEAHLLGHLLHKGLGLARGQHAQIKEKEPIKCPERSQELPGGGTCLTYLVERG